jgi:phospholipase C
MVSPSATTQYTLTATGSGGTANATASTTLTVQTPGVANSPITHLIILMMQNHTFDNLFGTFPGAAGLDATLPSYSQVDKAGNTVSPTLVQTLATADLNHNLPTYVASWDNGKMDKFAYTNGDLAMQYYDNTISGQATDGKTYGISTLWAYAQQYALADNLFSSAMNSEPADELYMVAATIHNSRTASALPYYDPCDAFQISSSGGVGTISVPLTETNVGDQLTANNVPWVFYQTSYANAQNGTCLDYVPQENPFQYFTSTQNSSHIQNFTMPVFKSALSNGTLPAVTWITPDGAHDMHPGPGNNILDGIEWLDQLVQAVQNSSEWQSTAIVVLFDEGGGWYDHVPPPQLVNTQGLGMRVPFIIISPFAKTNYISHQQMDFVSILRFIQWNWTLGEIPASAQATREQQSGDLCDLFVASACGAPSQ